MSVKREQLEQQKQKFKETELGLLPEDWDIVNLGELLQEVNIKARNLETNIQKLPILSMTRHKGLMLQTEKFRKRVAGKNLENYKVVKINDIVYGFPMDEGVIYASRKFKMGLVSPAYLVWELANENIDITFLDTLLKTPRLISIYTILSSKTVQRRRMVKKDDFRKIRVPIPPLSEQKEIAAILSVADDAIQKTNEVIGKVELLRRGLMQRLFTQGIGHTMFKQTELGEIPETWRIKKLGEVISLCQYGLSIRLSDKGRYPILRMNNLENGHVIESNMKYVDLNKNLFAQYKLEKGDILFNRTNSYDLVGKVGIFLQQREFTFASYLIRLRPKSQFVHPQYLNLFLTLEKTKNKLRRLATRSVSQVNINAKSLSTIKVAIPGIDEQKEIVNVIEVVDQMIQHEKQKRSLLKNVKRGLIQVLLTGKVRAMVA